MNDIIYTIVTMETLKKSEFGIETGCLRTVGWFSDFNEAKKIVENNVGDLNETIYNYAMIEEIPRGLYGMCSKRWVYEFDFEKDIYKEIEEPSIIKHYTNFSIG